MKEKLRLQIMAWKNELRSLKVTMEFFAQREEYIDALSVKMKCFQLDSCIEQTEKILQEDVVQNLLQPDVKFQLPSDKEMIDVAILFNDGILDKQKLSDMVAYGQFIVDRLYENGDITKPSSKEHDN